MPALALALILVCKRLSKRCALAQSVTAIESLLAAKCAHCAFHFAYFPCLSWYSCASAQLSLNALSLHVVFAVCVYTPLDCDIEDRIFRSSRKHR